MWKTHHNILSPEACAEIIAAGERTGFDQAPITTARGFVMRPDIRNNTRVMFDDHDLAADLWSRLQPWPRWKRVPDTAIGLNERFRIYRYAPGQRFNWHHDGAFRRDAHEQSRLTLLLYLNEDYEGGTTDLQVWPDSGRPEVHRIHPQTGMALAFVHRLRHQGAKVTSGVKYVLRTDVMYRDQSVCPGGPDT